MLKNLTIELLIIASVVGVLLIVLVIVLSVDLANRSIVSKNSNKIKKLFEINKQFSFKKIQTRYSYHKKCTSKRQFDNLNIDKYFVSMIKRNWDIFRNVIDSINFNEAQYNLYLNKYNSISLEIANENCGKNKYSQEEDYLRTKLSKEKFKKYEDKIFDSKKLRMPKFNIVIRCEITYTSPKGRNSYWKEQKYNYDDLIRLCNF